MTELSLPEIIAPSSFGENYHLVTTEEQLDSVCAEMLASNLIAVDTETQGLDYEDLIVGVCLSTKAGTGYYVPVRHEEYEGILYQDQLPVSLVFEKLRMPLESVPCVGHNIKFDQKMLWKDGIYCNFVADTLAIAKLYGNYPSNGLKFLVKQHFDHSMADLESLFPKRGNKKTPIRPAILSPAEICNYAVEDANWTLQLYQFYLEMRPSLAQESKANVLFNIEMNLLPCVGEIESFGLPVSKKFLQEQSVKAKTRIARLEKDIVGNIRERLNDPDYTISLNSSAQIAKLLFEDLKMPITERSPKTGKPSASKAVLESLADQDPITRKILTHRGLKKLNSTYLEGLAPQVYSDGRIRGNFNQFGTATGRFNSSKPNLQNLPRNQAFYLWRVTSEEEQLLFEEFGEILRSSEDAVEFKNVQKDEWESEGELGAASNGTHYGVSDGTLVEMWHCRTRNFVAASPNHYLVEADYSQVELRIMAGESGEPTLMKAFASGDDVHQATAATVFGLPFEKVTYEQRQVGKTINFSLLFGAGADNIASQLQIDVKEAERLIAKYFENLPNIGNWIDSTKKAAASSGFAETPLGRKRSFALINSRDKWAAAKEQREAVNFKIQGAAADVMKVALVRTHARLKKYFGDKARIVSTVHDSALVEVHESISQEDITAVLKDGMTGFAQSFAPHWPELIIDLKFGTSWADAKDVKFENVTLPPVYEGELEKIAVRQLGQERELGLGFSVPDEGGQTDIFSTLAEKPAPIISKGSWVIKVPEALNTTQLSGLTTFLQDRHDPEALATVSLLMPDETGELKINPINGTFALSKADEMALKIKIGPCELLQELDDIDPDDVLRGVDFGL